MSLYQLRANGKIYDLNIVQNMPFSGEQSIIVYEAPGGDGGAVLSTGRLNKKLTFEGQLLSKESDMDNIRQDLNDKIEEISNLRDNAIPVKVISPIVNNDTGIYLIRNFNGRVTEGRGNTIPFTMELEEYRQKGVRRSSVNLVNYQPAELLKARARDRNVLAGD